MKNFNQKSLVGKVFQTKFEIRFYTDLKCSDKLSAAKGTRFIYLETLENVNAERPYHKILFDGKIMFLYFYSEDRFFLHCEEVEC